MQQPCDPLLEGLSRDLAGSFQQLVLMYQNRLYAFALRQTGNKHEAEDIMQEAFLQAYVALEQYPAWRILELKLQPWLYKITLHVYYNYARKRRVLVETLDLSEESTVLEIPDDRQEGPEELLESAERLREVSDLLLKLPEKYRLVINCYYFADLSYQEIADLLKLPLGTVKSSIHRALRLLRTSLTA